jgi:hypothetical protein
MKSRSIQPTSLLFVALFLLIFWNFWLPEAQTFFNLLSGRARANNIDFTAYYRGGQAYLQGQDPYSGTSGGQPFIYPPTFIPLFALLADLSYKRARYLWLGLYSLFFILNLLLLLYYSHRSERVPLTRIVAIIAITSTPLLWVIRQGQIDLITISLCFASFLFYRKKFSMISAFLLAVATLVKVNPLLFMITYLVFFRDFKYLLRYLACLAGLVAISALFFPLNWYLVYISQVLPALTAGKTSFLNQTVVRIFAHQPVLPQITTLLGFGLFTLFSWFAGAKLKQHTGSDLAEQDFFAFAQFLMNAITILLFSGSTWLMAYVWIILPSAPVILYLLRHGSVLSVAMAGTALFCLNATPLDLPFFRWVNVIGGILMLACLGYLVFQKDQVTLAAIPSP